MVYMSFNEKSLNFIQLFHEVNIDNTVSYKFNLAMGFEEVDMKT
jgi:hypothetical protein